MARPERNNIDYFPFFCEEGKKMFYIEETYGNDGFSTFIKLLRELAKTDYHYLDLSKGTTIMFLSAKCKISKDLLLAIINDLVELGKFNEMLWTENRVIWCQDFVDSIQDAYKKRNNKCISFEGLLLLLEGLGVRKPSKSTTTVPVKPQSKVKESKVEESRVDEEEKTAPTKPSFVFYTIKDFEEQNEIGQNEFTLLAKRRTGKSIEDLAKLILVFISEQKALSKVIWKDQTDAKQHFINWAVKQQSPSTKSKLQY